MAQSMPLPLTVSCFSKIQTGITFLVLAHPRSLGHLDKESINGCCYVVRGNLNAHRVKSGCAMDAILIPRAEQSSKPVHWTTTFCKLSLSVLVAHDRRAPDDEHGRLGPVILPVPAHREPDAECMSGT